MKRTCILLLLIAPLEFAACAEMPASTDEQDAATIKDPLVINPDGVWTTPTSDVCFKAGGGQIASGWPSMCLRAATTGQVWLYSCSSAADTVWFPQIDRTLRAGGRCLQPVGGSTASETPIETATCNGATTQQWTHPDNDSTKWKNVGSGLCLTAPIAYDGVLVILRPCGSSTTGQTWTLPNVEISGETRRQLRDSVMNTWGAATQLNLRNWSTCPANPNTLTNPTVIQARLGDGRFASGENGYRIVTFDLVETKLALDYQEWNRSGMIHEFGHLLGFSHEQARRDNQSGNYCNNFQGGSWNTEPANRAKQIDYGPYDPTSAMSYCALKSPVNETTLGWGNLSYNDILGVRWVKVAGTSTPAYGARDFRRAVWASNTSKSISLPTVQTLTSGASFLSIDKKVALRMQFDGRLVVVRTDLPSMPPLWTAPQSTYLAGSYANFGADGILRVYYSGGALAWQSTKARYPGATLNIQHDGNVVIRNSSGSIVWGANTYHRHDLEGAVGLAPGASLTAPATKTTGSGRFQLNMQLDGNLVVYDTVLHSALWATGTWGSAARTATMLTDGTLALFDAAGNRVPWTVPFTGKPGNFLALQDDGNLVVYEPAKYEVWSAGAGNGEDGAVGAFVPTFDAPPVMLWRGSSLAQNQRLCTPSGRACLIMQSDGNLVYYVDNAARWSSRTWLKGGIRGTLTFGGDLQVTDAQDGLLYHSDTQQYMNSYLTFTDAGRLSLYRVVSDQADGIGFEY
jgi:hypothetical protein